MSEHATGAHESFHPTRILSGGLALMFSAAILSNVLFLQDGSRANLAARPGATTVSGKAEAGYARLSVSVKDGDGGNDTRRVAASSLVADVQQALSKMGRYSGEIDGRLGPMTRMAILNFQNANGMPADGLASQDLLERIRFNSKIEAATTFTASVSQSEDETSPTIARVQQGLARLGYDAGPADGRMGLKTREAIKQYQTDRNLPVSGEIGPGLLAEMVALN